MGVMNELAFCKRWVGNKGVLTRMVLNLGMLKILLLRPTRSDQYNMGPEEVSFTAMATVSIGIKNRMNANNETNKSKILFCIPLNKIFNLIEKQIYNSPTQIPNPFLLPFTYYLKPFT